MECKPLLTGEYTEVLNGEVMFGNPKYGPKLNIDGFGSFEYSPISNVLDITSFVDST